jgi:hypothetical protein
VTFVLFLISVLVLEAIVGPRPKHSDPQAPPQAEPESSPVHATGLLALNDALEAARGSSPAPGPVTAPPRQQEYNETDVRAQ